MITLPIFGKIKKKDFIFEGDRLVIFRDGFPISPGHTLIVPKRAVECFMLLGKDERDELIWMVDWVMGDLDVSLPIRPDGFNVGFNEGHAAGQTMLQFHCHVIPRYRGDVKDPRGGIRHVIPKKAKYWKK